MRWLDEGTYPQYREQIKSGDLLAWSGRSAIGVGIRALTASSWSHVGIAYALAGRVWVLEAREFSGVQIVPLSSYLECAWIPTAAKWTDSVDAYAVSKIGKVGYAYRKALQAWYTAASGKRVPLHPDADTQICSSFVPIVLRKAGVDFPDRLMTPSECVDCAVKLQDGWAAP